MTFEQLPIQFVFRLVGRNSTITRENNTLKKMSCLKTTTASYGYYGVADINDSNGFLVTNSSILTLKSIIPPATSKVINITRILEY
jgi:hypothetical protein